MKNLLHKLGSWTRSFRLTQFGNFGNLFSWDNSGSSLRVRLIVIIAGFILAFLIIAAKLISAALGEVDHRKYAQKNDSFRAEIVDRNGSLLAVNLPAASLFANPKKVIDKELVVKKLASVIPNLNQKNILSSLQSNANFVWIERDLSPKQQESIYNLGLPGFDFEKEQKRIYTYGNLLSHVIGYVGRDGNGLAGLEKQFDQFLKLPPVMQKDGTLQTQKLQLSIDVRLQTILSEEMDKAIEKFKAKGGAGIIIDPNTGEIMAMVSKPDFNPHYPGNEKPEKLFNVVTSGVYEIGSGMKSLTLAIGFDTNAITMNDVYDLSYLRVKNLTVKDAHPVKGWHSVSEIFLHSSNIGVSQVMLEIGKNNLRKYLKKLGLMDQLQIELPERSYPLFPNYSKWNDLSLVTMSYGYGISVSPAHFVQAIMPVVNGGIRYPLTLIKKGENEPLLGERVLSEETSKSMRQLMRLVVFDGTGKKADVPGYYVGGKTGTANKAVNGRYDMDKRISSFVGIIPSTSPKYLIYVALDEPKGIKETFGFAGGAWTATPAVGAILERLVVLYGLKKPEPESQEVQELTNFQYRINNET